MRTRRRLLPLVLLAVLLHGPVANAGSPCEITGDARLWAYDECLWRFETDDTLHPGVTACTDRNLLLIKQVGSCPAKRVIKDRICAMARERKLDDPAPETCMSLDRPLGPSVRDGGI